MSALRRSLLALLSGLLFASVTACGVSSSSSASPAERSGSAAAGSASPVEVAPAPGAVARGTPPAAAPATPPAPLVPAPVPPACAPADRSAANGLVLTARADRGAVAAGADILVALRLSLAPGQAGPLRVWDSKYSEGYRSWWFEVAMPDGTVRTLRLPVQDEWTKNAPHPVDLDGQRAYVLEGWGRQHGDDVAGTYYFSLHKLGLDTRAPGDYLITGRFAQDGGPRPSAWGAPACMWGGQLSSAAVRVIVG